MTAAPKTPLVPEPGPERVTPPKAPDKEPAANPDALDIEPKKFSIANVLRPILRPSEIAARENNPDAVTVGGAAIALGLVGLGVYMASEFLSTPAVTPRAIGKGPVPTPSARVPIPAPTVPRIRLGVSIADGRAHFSSFDTGPTRVVTSASGRSVTIVTTVVPVEIDLTVTEAAQPVTEVELNDTTEVRGEPVGGYALSFEVFDHSMSMDDPSIQFTVHHQVDQAYLSDDQLKIFVLSP